MRATGFCSDPPDLIIRRRDADQLLESVREIGDILVADAFCDFVHLDLDVVQLAHGLTDPVPGQVGIQPGIHFGLEQAGKVALTEADGTGDPANADITVLVMALDVFDCIQDIPVPDRAFGL